MEVTRAALITAIQSASREDFSRSGGPGGQNVNKVNTQVTLRIALPELAEAMGWAEMDRRRIEDKLASRINDGGELVIQVSDTRSQGRNREIAATRAADLIAHALRRPKRRRATRPSAGAKERRLEEKRRRSSIKKHRRAPDE